MTNEEAIKTLNWISEFDVILYSHSTPQYIEALYMAISALKAQDKGLDQWCTDCKEYDAEKHCCPRFNRVIREALQDSTQTNAESTQDLISRQDVPDTNVGDMVSRQDAIDCVDCGHLRPPTELAWSDLDVVNMLKRLPSAEPDIPKWAQEVERLYNKALCKPYIKKPFAWALYEAWKMYDKMEV